MAETDYTACSRASTKDAQGKSCPKCSTLKSRSEFSKDKTRADGLKPYCKACRNADNRRYRTNNPEKSRASSANWAKNNPDKVLERARRLYAKNPEKYRKRRKEWRQSNIESALEMERELNRKRREKTTYRVYNSVGNQVRSAIRSMKGGSRTFDLLGYTLQELMQHLERQFAKGMTWDNYGEWHIDHINPLSSFEITGPNDPAIRDAWALTNLQPLWAKDNISKSNKRIYLL